MAKAGRNKSASFLHKVDENESHKPKRKTVSVGSFSKPHNARRYGKLQPRLVKSNIIWSKHFSSLFGC